MKYENELIEYTDERWNEGNSSAFQLRLHHNLLLAIDDALEAMPTIQNREHFVVLAIAWALESVNEKVALVMMGLDCDPAHEST